MAITNPTSLPAIAFSKNDLFFIAQSDTADYLAGVPAKAVNSLAFPGVIADELVIGLGWLAGGADMTATASTPDGSGFQFPSGDGSAGYVASLVPYFQANQFIDRDFVVSFDNTGLYPRLMFAALQYGDEYNFIPTGNQDTPTPGVDNSPVANFAHHLEPWIDDGTGTFTQVCEMNAPLDYPFTGRTTTNISDSLHSFLSPDYPVLGAAYQQCVNSIRAYYIKFAQFFGDNPSVQGINRLATPYPVITWGGLGMGPSLVRDIFAELAPGGVDDQTQNRFLRQGSKNITVTKDQPEWLTYINLSGAAQGVKLEITVTNADSTTFVIVPDDYVGIAPCQKFQWQAGYTQLGIEGRLAGKVPVYYTCRLRTVGGYVTDSYNFVIDYNYREFPRYFVYFNAYGAYQTIATVGKGQLEYDRTKDDAQLALSRTMAAQNGDFLECNIFITDKGTINIGYDRADNRKTMLLRDFILSQSIFQYDNGALIPIGLNTKNLKDAMDGDNAYANAIEYFVKYNSETWTEAPQPDDSLAQLIIDAGSPVPTEVAPPETSSGEAVIRVLFGDTGFDEETLTYTDLTDLGGKTGYVIYSSGMNGYLKLADVTYDADAGSFTIIIPGFTFSDRDELLIWPTLLIPPTS